MGHQAATDALSPVRWVHGDGVELPEPRVDGIAGGTHTDHADNAAVDFDNSPIRGRSSQIPFPSGKPLRSELDSPEEMSEAGIPRLDVNPSDDVSIIGNRTPRLNHACESCAEHR